MCYTHITGANSGVVAYQSYYVLHAYHWGKQWPYHGVVAYQSYYVLHAYHWGKQWRCGISELLRVTRISLGQTVAVSWRCGISELLRVTRISLGQTVAYRGGVAY